MMSSQHLQYWFYSQDCSAGLLCTVPPLSGRHSSLPRPSEWFRSKYSEWNKVVQLWQLGAGFRCGKSQMGLFENCGIIVHKMPIVQGKTMIIQPVDLCRFKGTPFSEIPERTRACEFLRKKKQSDSKESCENVVLGNGHPRNNTD